MGGIPTGMGSFACFHLPTAAMGRISLSLTCMWELGSSQLLLECSLQPVQAVIANAVLALQHALCSHTAPRGTGCDRDGALTQLRKNPFATFLP